MNLIQEKSSSSKQLNINNFIANKIHFHKFIEGSKIIQIIQARLEKIAEFKACQYYFRL